MKRFCLYVLLIIIPTVVFAQKGNTRWFEEGRLGMFIHYGVYSALNGYYEGVSLNHPAYTADQPFISTWGAEWILYVAGIPRENYRKYAQQFTASLFNADSIDKMAKDAGMKYIVFTVKHHDGFLMYPSNISDWCTTNSAAHGRDLTGELVTAAKSAGLKMGLYFSQNRDWMEEGGFGPIPEISYQSYTPSEMERYSKKTIRILNEIMDRYGKQIDMIWWDSPDVLSPKMKAFSESFLQAIKNHPNYSSRIIFNDRLSFNEGDFATQENSIDKFFQRPFELCTSVSWSWGYSSYIAYKDWPFVLDDILSANSKGGNILLNVPPKEDGTFDQQVYNIMHHLQVYTQLNGESIYGTQSNGMRYGQDFGRVTRRGNTLYLHYLLKTEPLILTGVYGDIESATLNGMAVPFEKKGHEFVFYPDSSVDNAVVKVAFSNIYMDGKKYFDEAKDENALSVYSSCTSNFMWVAPWGNCHGACCVPLKDMEWSVQTEKERNYDLYAEIGSEQSGMLQVSINGDIYEYPFSSTGKVDSFKVEKLGSIYLPAGTNEIKVIGNKKNTSVYVYRLLFDKKMQTSIWNEPDVCVIGHQICVSSDSDCIYRVVSMDGKTDLKRRGSGNFRFSVEESGIYIVWAQSGKNKWSQKLIVH